jgi:hypothetical protein
MARAGPTLAASRPLLAVISDQTGDAEDLDQTGDTEDLPVTREVSTRRVTPKVYG